MSDSDPKNNLDEITYREYAPRDDENLLDLFNLVFNRNYLLSYWKWANEENPNGRTRLKLAVNNSRVVGQSAAVPLVFDYKGEILRAARIQNVMVHPKFRRKGIFIKTLAGIEELLIKKQDDFVITFPNDNSLGAFIKLGYHHLFDIPTYELPIKGLDDEVDPDLEFDLRGNIRFNQKDRDFIASQLAPFDIFNQRDLNYLNWRYHQKSNRNYLVMGISKKEEQVGLIVCKPYPEGKTIDLVEFFIKRDESLIRCALNVLAKFYRGRELKAFNVWSKEHYPINPSLMDIGFTKTNQVTHAVYKSLSPRTSKKGDEVNSYYLAMGDSDVY